MKLQYFFVRILAAAALTVAPEIVLAHGGAGHGGGGGGHGFGRGGGGHAFVGGGGHGFGGGHAFGGGGGGHAFVGGSGHGFGGDHAFGGFTGRGFSPGFSGTRGFSTGRFSGRGDHGHFGERGFHGRDRDFRDRRFRDFDGGFFDFASTGFGYPGYYPDYSYDYPYSYYNDNGYLSVERAVQEELAKLGYYYGPVDGTIGPETVGGMRWLQ